LLQLDYDSGQFGPGDKKNSLYIDLHQLLSDGYQTYNRQKRVGGSGKYQYKISNKTTISIFTGLVDLWTNTPNTTNPTRSQVAQYGDNFLLSGNPTNPDGTVNAYYYGYNYYHVQTDFEYFGVHSDLGGGWTFDDKAYTTRYWNKQNYQNGATVNLSAGSPSGVDKLNGYRHAGDTATLAWDSKWGTFRSGVWYDWSYTDRYQIPSNILTWQDTPFSNFHEHFITQAFQPFAEYEWRATQKLVITAGIKAANYAMALDQYQDVKTVGCLGGTLVKATATTPAHCNGGAAFINHSIDYNNWLPTLTARYRLRNNWSVYGEFAEGSVIPPSNVFDVTNGAVLTPPKPTLAKTYQTGSVLKFNRWTLDVDAYYVHFQNGYQSYLDPTTTESVFVATGPSNTKGIEAESNIVLGHGFSFYLNGSLGSAKYQEGKNIPNGGLWVANTPKNVETFGFLWQKKNWDVGIFHKRVGTMYNDNASLTYLINGIKVPYPVDQAITINPFDLTNLFLNYTIKGSSWLRGSKIGFAANNLFDNHNVVGVTPAIPPTTSVAYVQNGNDLLNLLPGRSFMVTLTIGYAPRR
jgi:iron complex outermembrane receptor protein